jgi:cellulose synthase/poly-beta-1,6-N-acetylglucosamine synthase-like glycosyltransferase
LSHEQCRGEAHARTTGSKAAAGEIILHGEADAWYPPDYIERGVKYFDDPEIMAVTVGEIRVLDSQKGLVADYCRMRRRASCILRSRGKISTAGCHLVRREVFERIGYYDPTYTIGNDLDFALRIESAGMRCVLGSDLYFSHADPASLPVYVRRVFRGSLTQKEFLKRWGRWPRGLKKHLWVLWNIGVTLSPLCLIGLWVHWAWALPLAFFAGCESLAPFLFHSESRLTLGLSLRRGKLLLAMALPGLVFLRLRAVSYGRLCSMIFARRVGKMVTYD